MTPNIKAKRERKKTFGQNSCIHITRLYDIKQQRHKSHFCIGFRIYCHLFGWNTQIGARFSFFLLFDLTSGFFKSLFFFFLLLFVIMKMGFIYVRGSKLCLVTRSLFNRVVYQMVNLVVNLLWLNTNAFIS